MVMRTPATRGYGRSAYFAAPDIAYARLLLQLHDQAGCDDLNCPADRLDAFLAQLETELMTIGGRARAQIWASLFILPRPDIAPRLEQRIPLTSERRTSR
jgi:hypothetical protein